MKILGKTLVGFARYRRNQVIKTILDSAEAQNTFTELEQKKHQSVEVSRAKANQILLELTSAFNQHALHLCYWIVRFLKQSMFKSVVTYGDEIKEIQKLTKDGKIIFFLPNHKSHMDYLILSYILFNNGIAPPHIAAGVNLSFFPVGGLFRRTGAYFIRRKIAGNFLYTKFLQLYFDWMLQEKISQEFYMEGGRSRDGKLRKAQSGIFTLFVEQVRARGMESQVYFVPTGITYDRLPEMQSLLSELQGAEKEKENVFTLLQSLSILWTNHGHVHFQFGKPLSLASILPNDYSKKTFHNLSHQIFTQVQKQKTITVPGLMAIILLTATDKMNRDEVYAHMQWLMKFLKPCQQCISEQLANIQKDWNSILDQFEKLGWFELQGTHLIINCKKRMEMNYYKNDLFPVLLPFFSGEDPFVQNILQHEYPYADHSKSKRQLDENESEFLRNTCKPMLFLYQEILTHIQAQDQESLSAKDVQKKLLTSISEKHKSFPYPEMLTMEAVKSASLFFHQHADELKNPTIVESWKKIL